MDYPMFNGRWGTEIPNVGIPIILDSLLVAVLLGRYRSPRFLFFWVLLSRFLTYPIFYLLGLVFFSVARNPYIEMFLRHALSGLSGFILAEILTVVAAGYLLRFICQRMSSPSDTLAIPTVRQCCYISLAGNIVAFVTSMFLSFIYQDYVHGHH